MQVQNASVVSADAISVGITKDDAFFDNFSRETHARHDRLTCNDAFCARCGQSTSGPALKGNLRAGDVTEDCGTPAYDSRTYHPLNERVDAAAVGNIDEVLKGKAPTSYLGDTVENLMKASSKPDRRGGGSNGRKRTEGCSPDFGVTQGQIIRDILRYA